MTANNLRTFIEHARSKGMDHATIRTLLLSAGWREKEVVQALVDQELEMQVPIPPDAGSARDAFFHLLAFSALYTSVISTISLFFSYINRLFPDVALEGSYQYENFTGERWLLAALMVSFPLFLWCSRLIVKEIALNPEKAMGGVRRWLTHLTLFVGAAAIIGDLITLVFSLLEGELTTRFLLKVFVVFALAGFACVYYLLSLRLAPGQKQSRKLNRISLIIALAVAGIAIVWGIVLVGSPASERLRKFDDRRVENLRSLQDAVFNIVYDYRPYDVEQKPVQPIPATVAEVASGTKEYKLETADPETGVPYDYVVLSPDTFKLCATFTYERSVDYDLVWNHGPGYQCFTFDLDDHSKRF
ncbi:MAG: DUF5671 domain-containing protein [Candidatus Peribacteraceae bacterium]|nr:DUF5671 domain-containing protein [Candidatus Peribacteraceae bacterium]